MGITQVEEGEPAGLTVRIATPAEVLDAPREGTALDLAVTLAGACLGVGLLPLLVVTERDPLVLVSRTHRRADWDSPGRPEYELLSDGPVTDVELLRALVAAGAYLPVESSGFAAPHGRSFVEAVEAGHRQLHGDHVRLRFAIDLAIAHDLWEIPPRRVSGSTAVAVGGKRPTRLRFAAGGALLEAARALPIVRVVPTPLQPLQQLRAAFVGRGRERLMAAVAISARRPVGLLGEDGSGKTSLLRQIGEREGGAFRDGVAFVTHHGEPAADLLRSIYDCFYEADDPYQPGAAELAEALAGKQALVLVDDVTLPGDELRQVVEHMPESVVVATSRSAESLQPTRIVPIGEMDVDDALAMFTSIAGDGPLGAVRDAARDLTKALELQPGRLAVMARLTALDEGPEQRRDEPLVEPPVPPPGTAGAAEAVVGKAEAALSRFELLQRRARDAALAAQMVPGPVGAVGARVLQLVGRADESHNTVRGIVDGVKVNVARFRKVQRTWQAVADTAKAARGVGDEGGVAALVDSAGQAAASLEDAAAALEGGEAGTSAAEAGATPTPAGKDARTAAAAASKTARKVISVLTFLRNPTPAGVLERLAGRDVRPVLQTLVAAGVVVRHSPRYSLAGSLRDDFRRVRPPEDMAVETLAAVTEWAESGPGPDAIVAEAGLVQEVLDQGVKRQEWHLTRRLALSTESALALGGRWGLWESVLQAGLEASQRLGDHATAALMLHQLGTRAAALGDDDDARRQLRKARSLRRQHGLAAAATAHNLRRLGRRLSRLALALLIAAGLLLTVGGVVLAGQLAGGGSEDGAAPVAFTPLSVDFGSVPLGRTATAAVTLENTLDRPVTIDGLVVAADPAAQGAPCDEPGCGPEVLAAGEVPLAGDGLAQALIGGPFSVQSVVCPEPAAEVPTIPAGSACEATFAFSPFETGAYAATAVLTVGGDELPGLALTGMGTWLVVEPESIDFGDVDVDAGAAVADVTIGNVSDAAGSFTLRLTLPPGPGSGAPGLALDTGTCGDRALAPGAACRAIVRFDPAETGPYAGEVVVAPADAPPVAVPVRGEGIIGPPPTSACSLAATPGELVLDDAAPVATVTVTNAGTAPCTISATRRAGGAADAFSHRGCPPGTMLAAGGPGCDISVAFEATASGEYAATLEVVGEGGNGGATVLRVPLSGTLAGGCSLVASPPNVLIASPTATATVAISNVGSGPCEIATVQRTGPAAARFTHAGCAPATLAPRSGSCEITISFAGGQAGSYTAGLDVTATGPDGAAATASVVLRAELAAPPEPPPPGEARLVASHADLPLALALGRSGRTVDVTNVGPGTVRGLRVTAPAGTGFRIDADPCSGRDLAPGSSCTITLSYQASDVVRKSDLVIAGSGAATVRVAVVGLPR